MNLICLEEILIRLEKITFSKYAYKQMFGASINTANT